MILVEHRNIRKNSVLSKTMEVNPLNSSNEKGYAINTPFKNSKVLSNNAHTKRLKRTTSFAKKSSSLPF